jgi:hypothetical protein
MQADLDQVINYLFDYSGRLMEKIGRLDKLIGTKDSLNNKEDGYPLSHLEAIRVIRDNLIDEVILIEKKADLFQNYG